MPKYYIQSGQLKSIIDRQTVELAIMGVLEKLHGKGIIVSPKICVSERGWYDDNCFDTDFFLKHLYEDK